MIEHKTQIRVRYGETDRMGYAHHGNYPLYFEEGRTELMRHLGVDYKALEESGIMLPVINLQIDYKSPAFYDDVLEVKTFLKEKPGIRIIFHYEITNQNQKLVCKGQTTLVFVDSETRKPIRLSDEQLSVFSIF